jgi:hypothetical protein
MYDDQKVYFEGLIEFIKDVDQGLFNKRWLISKKNMN